MRSKLVRERPKTIDDYCARFDALLEQGDCYRAIRSLEKMFKICIKISDSNLESKKIYPRLNRAYSLLGIKMVGKDERKYTKFFLVGRHCFSMLAHQTELNDFFWSGNLKRIAGNIEGLFKEAKKYAPENKIWRTMCDIYLLATNIARKNSRENKEKIDKLFLSLYRSYENCEIESGQWLFVDELLADIAFLFYKKKDFARSKDLIGKSFAFVAHLDESNQKKLIYAGKFLSLAFTYFGCKEYEESVSYALHALNALQLSSSTPPNIKTSTTSTAYRNLSMIFRDLGYYEEAIKYAEDGLRIALDNDLPTDSFVSFIAGNKAYLSRSKRFGGIFHYKKAPLRMKPIIIDGIVVSEELPPPPALEDEVVSVIDVDLSMLSSDEDPVRSLLELDGP